MASRAIKVLTPHKTNYELICFWKTLISLCWLGASQSYYGWFMSTVILSMCESRWALSGVHEVPLIPAVALVGTVIPEVARVAVVEGVVPLAVTTIIIAEVEAVVAVTSISSIMDRSGQLSHLHWV